LILSLALAVGLMIGAAIGHVQDRAANPRSGLEPVDASGHLVS
jgi:hypothetical protein